MKNVYNEFIGAASAWAAELVKVKVKVVFSR